MKVSNMKQQKVWVRGLRKIDEIIIHCDICDACLQDNRLSKRLNIKESRKRARMTSFMLCQNLPVAFLTPDKTS